MYGLGLPELGTVAAIIIVLFGSSRLPQLGKGLGEAISGFRKAVKGADHGKTESLTKEEKI